MRLTITTLVLVSVASGQYRYQQSAPNPDSRFYTFRRGRSEENINYYSKPYYKIYPSASNQEPQLQQPPSRLASFLAGNSATIIKHPGTCTYDRSQSACTFSLLCYLASGVPVEGCEENASVTCCVLKGLGPRAQAKADSPSPTITIYRHVSAGPANPQTLPAPAGPDLPPSGVATLRTAYQQPTTMINTLANYYIPVSHIRSSYTPPLMSTDSALTNKFATVEPGYPMEMDSSKELYDKANKDPYYNNAIRRTRTENLNSIFQEIASRKQYSKNYDPEEICGKPMDKPRSRIIGGQDAYFGEFPWQVHIKITKHQCGGALINSHFIVTAAHCIYQAPMHQLNVIIGAHDIEDHRFQDIPPQYFGVSKVILHPNFRFSASHPDRYDIALIKLDSQVRFSDSVLPVCLPEENFHFEGWNGVVTGWGKTDPALSNRFGTRLLQKVDVPIIDNEKCESWHRTRGIDLRIFSEMMCAGYEDGLKDACVGDSGGPLVINVHGRWTLAGITSAGFGCAQSRQPGIYHRVSNTVEWIKSTLQSEKEMILRR